MSRLFGFVFAAFVGSLMAESAAAQATTDDVRWVNQCVRDSAGYAVSEPVGNAAVIVKLFRVFLLLPVVLGIGWWLAAAGERASAAKVPVPIFAIMFLVL